MSNREQEAGDRMMRLMTSLFPICRSITGDGLRETLRRIQREIPIAIHEVPTGTPVLDWTIPREWNIRDAYIRPAGGGARVADFQRLNLEVVNYSVPFTGTLPLAELRPHLFSLPDRPDRVPYRTSYYQDSWGFCLRHRDLEQLTDGDYEVCVDSTLAPGALSYGELLIPGASSDEVLISTHCCHPSLANDNLSGIAVAVELAQHLLAEPRRYSYRVLFIPGTIGAITWLATHEETVNRVQHGFVITGVGDRGGLTYKRSRRGAAPIDRAFAHVLSHGDAPFTLLDFTPYGYDERQYCSPGYDLPVGCLMRTPWGQYEAYHTSADDLSFVDPASLGQTLARCADVVAVLEGDERFVNTSPKGEPQLGRRGLYKGSTGRTNLPHFELALLWVLNQSDGSASLLDIAERAKMPFRVIRKAAEDLRSAGLLEPAAA